MPRWAYSNSSAYRCSGAARVRSRRCSADRSSVVGTALSVIFPPAGGAWPEGHRKDASREHFFVSDRRACGSILEARLWPLRPRIREDCPETDRPTKKYVVDLNVSLQICV